MKNFNPNENQQQDNEHVASGSVSLKFNLTQKTIIAIVSSVSLFSSGFYAGFTHGQNVAKSLEMAPSFMPESLPGTSLLPTVPKKA
jgi:ABC-type uncharacterized transport system fused permease/ATPase subunit